MRQSGASCSARRLPSGDEAIRRLFKREFDVFEGRLPQRRADTHTPRRWVRAYADPAADGGLPEGWTVRWTTKYPCNDGAVDSVLIVERAHGGWGVVFHLTSTGSAPTTMLWTQASATLGGLYACAVSGRECGALTPDVDIREFICAHYDLTDPIESAEAMVVAMGGVVDRIPRALAPLP